MKFGVFVRTDSTGPWPVIVTPETVFGADDRRALWRYVAQTDDFEEARSVRAALHEKRERGEL
jgi:hypothetical protein